MSRSAPTSSSIVRDLRRSVGKGCVLDSVPHEYLVDATELRGLVGTASAVALPETPEQVRAIVAWCYEHDVPIVPRGGGTGLAGGAVPLHGGVVLSLERLNAVRALDPLLWRMEVEAGRSTASVRSLARDNGLLFPPDPGAAEQSQIGGNAATNAGGPHAFKYGVTGRWVTGIEAVVAPGELLSVGGAVRKDAAGYDLKSLLIGSEGTLAVITSLWLRLMPAPEASAPVVSFHADAQRGCAAIERVLGNGIPVAALEFLDVEAVATSSRSFPGAARSARGFMVIGEVDGDEEQVRRLRTELVQILAEDAVDVVTPTSGAEIAELWKWRHGVSLTIQARRGGKASEDIVVPVDRLAEAIEGTLEIGRRHGLPACSWGHAGDGNLHSTFMIRPGEHEDSSRAHAAAEDLFALAVRLGGSISGEHGIGAVKNGQLARQWTPRAIELHEAVKRLFDPKGLINPGKKLAR
jgi:glycolate oxidase subunit GlcD